MPFTLGLISDVHADLHALMTALDIMQRQRVDAILCAGDLVEKGADGDAVVQQMRERSIPCVLGNHDEAAIDNQRWLRQYGDPAHPNMRGRLLNPETLQYLQQLPRFLRFIWAGKRVLLVHGTLHSNVVYLLLTTPPETYKTIARHSEADVIIFGHTHTPMQGFYEGVWFFNPGALVGGGRDNRRTCATLSIPDCRYRVFDLATGEAISVPFLHE